MAAGRSTKEMRRIRRSVYRAYRFTCVDCGTWFAPPRHWNGEGIEGLTLGHIRPKAQGGAYSVGNCVPQCKRDNEDLANRPWIKNWREIYAREETA